MQILNPLQMLNVRCYPVPGTPIEIERTWQVQGIKLGELEEFEQPNWTHLTRRHMNRQIFLTCKKSSMSTLNETERTRWARQKNLCIHDKYT